MLSPQLRSDIRRLWDAFWAGGISNPLTAIEQITYLVFLKQLEDLDNKYRQIAEEAGRQHRSVYDVEKGYTYRWNYIKRLSDPEKRLQHVRGPVFNWLKTIDESKERMRDAVFVIPSASLLTRAIQILDKLFVPERNQDTLGDIYEMLLAEIAEAGKNGQFRTPRHIIRAMCALVDPQLGERICDPACGTAGFLVNAYQHILMQHSSHDILRFRSDGTPIHAIGDQLTAEEHKALRQNHFYGFDFDRTMVRLGWMNMIQHGLEVPQIENTNTLASKWNPEVDEGGKWHEAFQVVLANPPFAAKIDKNDIGPSLREVGSTRSELLFLELILQLLDPNGGRAAVIVPEGVLFGSTRAHRNLRKKLVEKSDLRAVISLPAGVFQPYTGVKTSILVFYKGGHTQAVWFYELRADGYSLNARRDENPETNDLWDMQLQYKLRYGTIPPAFVDGTTWEAWRNLSEDEQSETYAQPQFREAKEKTSEGEEIKVQELARLDLMPTEEAKQWEAPLGELAENAYNLTAGRYKPFELEPMKYDPPEQILKELQDVENLIASKLDNLLAMIQGEG